MNERQDQMKICEEATGQLTILLEEGISRVDFEIWVRQYPECAELLMVQFKTWEELALISVPEPNTRMHARFYKSLSEIRFQQSPSIWQRWNATFNRWINLLNPTMKWSLLAAVFIFGIFSGYFLIPVKAPMDQGFVNSFEDQNIILTEWQNQESVGARLKQVQEVKDLKSPDERIFEALNNVLLHDPNTNVRLSAIESLLFFAEAPKVREYLIEAIPYQDSPLVQIALADAMLRLHEKRSSKQWEQLFGSDQIEMEVKMYVRETLEPLFY